MDLYEADEVSLYKVSILKTGQMIFCPVCHHALFANIPNDTSITCGLCHNIMNFNGRVEDIFELEMTYEEYNAPRSR